VLPTLARINRAIAKVVKGVLTFFPSQQDRSAPATITTGGATLRHELLAPERNATVAAVATLYVDDGFV